MSVNSRLKAIQIKGQRKAFYRQRIPKFSYPWLDIHVKSGNGDRKIMQSIRIMSRHLSRIRKWNHLSQFRRTSTKVSNTHRKDLSWLHFDDEPKVQERQQGQNQESRISVFVPYLTTPSSNQGHQPRRGSSIPCMGLWYFIRDSEQPQEKETSQNESRLKFSWRQFQQQR